MSLVIGLLVTMAVVFGTIALAAWACYRQGRALLRPTGRQQVVPFCHCGLVTRRVKYKGSWYSACRIHGFNYGALDSGGD